VLRLARENPRLGGDFFETVTLTGARLYVLGVIEHASQRIRIPGDPSSHCILGSPNALMERWVQTCRRELLDRTPDLEPAPPALRSA
jgi:hypothetical protein